MLPGGVIRYVLNALIKIYSLSLMPIWRNTYLNIAIKYKTIHYLRRKKNHQLSPKDKQVVFNYLILNPTLQIYNATFSPFLTGLAKVILS